MSDMDNVSVSTRRVDPSEIEARFHALVQSPLRAGLLRFLSRESIPHPDTVGDGRRGMGNQQTGPAGWSAWGRGGMS